MDNRRLRSVILNLRYRLTKDDRKRLRFYLGTDEIRRIQDHPTLAGTLNLIGSLLDQNRINDMNLTHLINALHEIHCRDAVDRLREYRNRNCANHSNPLMHTLSEVMPVRRRHQSGPVSLHRDATNPDDMTGSRKRELLKKCSLVFALLFLVIDTELLVLSIWTNIKFRQMEETNFGFMEAMERITTKERTVAANLNESEKTLQILERQKKAT
ncbi:hypothetical protein I4U23_027426 [Adineta vaga]|nr:hypothetical protein I4U23_027426 [Adineta vaga]